MSEDWEWSIVNCDIYTHFDAHYALLCFGSKNVCDSPSTCSLFGQFIFMILKFLFIEKMKRYDLPSTILLHHVYLTFQQMLRFCLKSSCKVLLINLFQICMDQYFEFFWVVIIVSCWLLRWLTMALILNLIIAVSTISPTRTVPFCCFLEKQLLI
jgi:hypothetical protein